MDILLIWKKFRKRKIKRYDPSRATVNRHQIIKWLDAGIIPFSQKICVTLTGSSHSNSHHKSYPMNEHGHLHRHRMLWSTVFQHWSFCSLIYAHCQRKDRCRWYAGVLREWWQGTHSQISQLFPSCPDITSLSSPPTLTCSPASLVPTSHINKNPSEIPIPLPYDPSAVCFLPIPTLNPSYICFLCNCSQDSQKW